jgi:pyruvate formate-lyase/glycerol dehydratase family glycyl radical enzyme
MKTKQLLPEGMDRSTRIKFLNTRMRGVKPSICTDRARLITESYRMTEGQPYVLRRAEGLKYVLENMDIFIDEEELIVGNHGSKPRSAPMFPESCSFDRKELDLMPVRKVDTLQITKEQKEYLLHDIYPYWRTQNTGDLSRYYFDDEVLRVLDSPYRVFNPLSRTRSGHGHYLPNIRKVIRSGFQQIEKEAREGLSNLNLLEPDYSDRMIFYKAILLIIEGIRTFQNRFAELAREMADKEQDARRRQELLLIEKNCRRVPYYPAENFFEALQSYWFTLLIDYIGQNGSATSGGRLDQILLPYYEKDMAADTLAREEALELLEALWVKHSDVIKAGSYETCRNNGGFSTAFNITLGGEDENGENAVTDLTFLCLDAERDVFNAEPNTSIRVSKKNPDSYLRRVFEILKEKEGGKMPFFSDETIVPALERDGVNREDALNYAIVGCVEPTPYGNTFGSTNAGFFNLAKCLELSMTDGMCRMSGMQMGPHTGNLTDFHCIEDLKQAYETQVKHFVEMLVHSLNATEKVVGDYTPHIYCSMLLDGCMERGRDCTKGGANYNYIGVQGVGIADVGDSLTAIDILVFRRQRFTMEELAEALSVNFEGWEYMHSLLINDAPKYGNAIPEADRMVSYVAKQYCDCVNSKKTIRGGHFRAGLFCLSSNTPLGRQVGALPSGRSAGTPLGDGGISPKHGMDINGPVSAAISVASIPQAEGLNGVNYNLKFMPSLLRTKEDRQKLVEFIRAYFELGGMHIQFNILTTEKLRAAQENPERYRSLVVRVAGYSAFFVELDRDIQNEIISRTIYGEV